MKLSLDEQVETLIDMLSDGAANYSPGEIRVAVKATVHRARSEAYAKGFADGQRSGPPPQSIDDLLREE